MNVGHPLDRKQTLFKGGLKDACDSQCVSYKLDSEPAYSIDIKPFYPHHQHNYMYSLLIN